jgi:DNA replication protein DnaC
MVQATLCESLKKLRLSGMAQSLEVRLQEASSNRLDHGEFLELVLQDELAVRRERLIARRTQSASFREQKTLEDFEWDFNRSVKKKQIYDLAAGGFVRQRRDVLLCGPPGVGKSHLAQGIGLKLIHTGWTVLYRSIFDAVRDLLHDEAFEGHERVMAKYLKVDLLILDDMGMKQLPLPISTLLMNYRKGRSVTATTRSTARKSSSFVGLTRCTISSVSRTTSNSPSPPGCSIPSSVDV